MAKSIALTWVFIVVIVAVADRALSFECSDKEASSGVAKRIDAAFKNVRDYTCDVEIIFYQDGAENQRYRLKFYFKREKKIRVDFNHPYKSVIVFFRGGDEKVTVKPLRFLPGLRFRFSIDNSMVRTPTGQRIDQTGMEHFVEFLLKNLRSVPQIQHECKEDEGRIDFLLWALDHIEEKSLEKYRISISKTNWFPVRIERYSLKDKLIEVAIFKDYAINNHLEDRLFNP